MVSCWVHMTRDPWSRPMLTTKSKIENSVPFGVDIFFKCLIFESCNILDTNVMCTMDKYDSFYKNKN